MERFGNQMGDTGWRVMGEVKGRPSDSQRVTHFSNSLRCAYGD